MPERLNLRAAVLLFVILLAAGTAGYTLTEGWTPWLALYAAVTTLTTLGTMRPTTTAGMAFTVVYLLVGVGTSFYILGSLVVYVAEGHFGESMRRRRMERAIERLRDHVIICGFGRVGREIATELDREGVPLVLIDINQESLAAAAAQGHPVITGSPAHDEVLREARVATARGLIAATDNDAENVYVTLAAHALRPDLFIVARANHPDVEPKLQKAGASRVISPYSVGGRLMAMLALRPLSVEFVETVLHSAGGDLLLEDIQVAARSQLEGLTVGELQRRYMPEAKVVALQRGAAVSLNPDPEVPLESGDRVAVIGTAAQLISLERAASE